MTGEPSPKVKLISSHYLWLTPDGDLELQPANVLYRGRTMINRQGVSLLLLPAAALLAGIMSG